jgi:hypothetical protein
MTRLEYIQMEQRDLSFPAELHRAPVAIMNTYAVTGMCTTEAGAFFTRAVYCCQNLAYFR